MMPIGSFIKKQITTSLPGKTIIGQSKRVYLPGFHGLSLYEIWRPFLEQLRKTSLTERAGGISFNIVMAIPPTLIFFFYADHLPAHIQAIYPGAVHHYPRYHPGRKKQCGYNPISE